MGTTIEYRGGENFDLRQMLLMGRSMRLSEKTGAFDLFFQDLEQSGEMLCMRCVSSAADREVRVTEAADGSERTMLMFGSNNYLGLATHPHVIQKVRQAIDTYGAGIGGPPLLNGTTRLHRELEERLAALKGTEDALIFSSGYAANVGLITGLVNAGDVVFYDSYSHASFCDGLKLAGAQSHRFPHNDMAGLEQLLRQSQSTRKGDIYVGVEGVYSMDGDLAPLDRILELCRKYDAILLVDDAHGTCVMGPTGRGTAEHFGVEGQVPITMGTFSKAFSVTGGFVAASRPVVNYLRFFARSYMFSASLPPAVIAAVLAGLDVMEREPGILESLRENIAYAAHGFQELGFDARPSAAIIPLLVPAWMDIRRAARKLHERGLFVNSVEYPAVPVSQQRFRISIMATHTRPDIDALLSAVQHVWSECALEAGQPSRPSSRFAA